MDTPDNDVMSSGEMIMPPMLQVTLLLPHDPDTEAKLGRLATTVLAMNGRVIDIGPHTQPRPVSGPTPVIGDIVATRVTDEPPAMAGSRRGGRGNGST